MFKRIVIIVLFILFISLVFMCNTPNNTKKTAENWYDKLPACPCENPDINGVKINDGWAKDAGDLNKYHKGAKESFRSYPAIITSEGKSCQQCCYDSSGKLITKGSGAGTPDKVSTCDGENSDGKMKIKYLSLLGHYFKDVRPWEKYGGEDSGWEKYDVFWPPNNVNACK